MPLRVLFVSGSYQNYQDGTVRNQLTDGGRGGGEESVLVVTVYLHVEC
jgi:hypothetical protein